MILFRVAKREFSTLPRLLDGVGAKLDGGRWNDIGERAVYLAEDPYTALAEKAFHSIVIGAIDYNFSLENGRRKTTAERELLVEQEFTITALDVELDQLSLVDISTAADVVQWSTVTNVDITFNECIFDVLSDVQDKTRRFARALLSSGYTGIIAPSARFEGNCYVLFPGAVPSPIDGSIQEQASTVLSAAHQNQREKYQPRPDGPIDETNVLAELPRPIGGLKGPTWVRVERRHSA